jgi:hypothetical protein
VISVWQKAKQNGIGYLQAKAMSDKELAQAINGSGGLERVQYRMPDYEHIFRLLRSSTWVTPFSLFINAKMALSHNYNSIAS